MNIEVNEYYRVYDEVGGEQYVDYNAQVVWQPAHEVEDGMWEPKYQVTDEHSQHGPCCIVHDLCRSRLVLTGGQATIVPLDL